MCLVNAPDKQTFANALQTIKDESLASWQYVVNSKPQQYCKGHPQYELAFNVGLNYSWVEREMLRMAELRKGSPSLLRLQIGTTVGLVGAWRTNARRWLP